MKSISQDGAVSDSGTAFTLMELLVTISIIGVLAGLTIPAVMKGLGKARQAACINHQRQLGLGFSMYHEDFQDLFPGCASRRTYGPQPEDWIWWQRDRDPNRSAIASYVSGFNPELFRCPTDKDVFKLKPDEENDPYLYSFSLTSYDMEGTTNLGMASIYTKDFPRNEYPFKVTAVRNPSQKLMLVEEDRINLKDGRWLPNFPSFDPLATRHQGKADVLFVDGHIQSVLPAFGTNAANSLAALE
ncbi:MAG: prepilin-type N-terminal cleavage/methylation domain-containing protein [Verrucomicrobia bacterium]|nr:prepilin-type N-terminal cleavage/methylation domain-containing protein [Verrucomicrobiota bacterium]